MAGGKYRSFLIHVKAVNDRGTEEICNGGIRPVVRIPSLKPQTNKGHSLASLLAKVAAGKVLNSQDICVQVVDLVWLMSSENKTAVRGVNIHGKFFFFFFF